MARSAGTSRRSHTTDANLGSTARCCSPKRAITWRGCGRWSPLGASSQSTCASLFRVDKWDPIPWTPSQTSASGSHGWDIWRRSDLRVHACGAGTTAPSLKSIFHACGCTSALRRNYGRVTSSLGSDDTHALVALALYTASEGNTLRYTGRCCSRHERSAVRSWASASSVRNDWRTYVWCQRLSRSR